MKDEERKLRGEHNTLEKALESSNMLIKQLEKERKRLAQELDKLGGHNVNKYQSALADSEIHR